MRPPADDLLQRLIASRGADREAAEWAADGLAAWLANAGGAIALPRFLGLQNSAKRVRLALRDRWLREAADRLSDQAKSTWARAVALRAEIEHFEAVRWPCWRREHLPPGRSTAVEKCLFFARRLGVIDLTDRQLRNILGKQFHG